MKFRMHCKNQRSDWWEYFDKECCDPIVWATDCISRFNDTLRPGELPRELVEVDILDSANVPEHKWEKLTAGMSIMFRGSCVDLMRCSRCGVTGKRYGLGSSVKRDSVFRAKKYEKCVNTS